MPVDGDQAELRPQFRHAPAAEHRERTSLSGCDSLAMPPPPAQIVPQETAGRGDRGRWIQPEVPPRHEFGFKLLSSSVDSGQRLAVYYTAAEVVTRAVVSVSRGW